MANIKLLIVHVVCVPALMPRDRLHPFMTSNSIGLETVRSDIWLVLLGPCIRQPTDRNDVKINVQRQLCVQISESIVQ